MKKLWFVMLVCLVCASNAMAVKLKDPSDPIVLIKTSMGDIYVELFAKSAPKTVENFIGLAQGTKKFTDPKTEKEVTRPFYDNLTFHRVIKNFMIQGGCPLGNGRGGPGYQFEDEINANSLGLDKIKAMNENDVPHPWLGIRNKEDFSRMVVTPLATAMGIKSQEDLDKRKEEFRKRIKSLTLKECYENQGYKYNDKLTSYKPERGCLAMANAGPNTNGSQFFIDLKDTPWLTGKHTVFGQVVKGMDVVDKIALVPVDDMAKPKEEVKIISIRLDKTLKKK